MTDTPSPRQMAADRPHLRSPAFERNARPILAVLRRVLADRTGDVLEIGSGPGQHIVAFAAALPGLTWWPSDPDPAHLASIAAWRADGGLANLRPPVALDAAAARWPLGGPGQPPRRGLAALVAVNVLHIAPWAVAEGLFAMAGEALAADGRMVLYGPYARDGAHTGPGNAAFDAALRSRDPGWGVRDTADIAVLAGATGLELAEIVAMPADNLCLVLRLAGRRPQTV